MHLFYLFLSQIFFSSFPNSDLEYFRCVPTCGIGSRFYVTNAMNTRKTSCNYFFYFNMKTIIYSYSEIDCANLQCALRTFKKVSALWCSNYSYHRHTVHFWMRHQKSIAFLSDIGNLTREKRKIPMCKMEINIFLQKRCKLTKWMSFVWKKKTLCKCD